MACETTGNTDLSPSWVEKFILVHSSKGFIFWLTQDIWHTIHMVGTHGRNSVHLTVPRNLRRSGQRDQVPLYPQCFPSIHLLQFLSFLRSCSTRNWQPGICHTGLSRDFQYLGCSCRKQIVPHSPLDILISAH